jgi:hypothetical protein
MYGRRSLAVATGLLAILIVGCGDSGSEVTAFSEDDPARVLADIDNGAAGLTNSHVYPYDTALGELAEVCNESRVEIGDMAVAGRNSASDEGADMSVLDVLEESSGMAYAVMESTGAEAGGSCQAVIAAAVTGGIVGGP